MATAVSEETEPATATMGRERPSSRKSQPRRRVSGRTPATPARVRSRDVSGGFALRSIGASACARAARRAGQAVSHSARSKLRIFSPALLVGGNRRGKPAPQPGVAPVDEELERRGTGAEEERMTRATRLAALNRRRREPSGGRLPPPAVNPAVNQPCGRSRIQTVVHGMFGGASSTEQAASARTVTQRERRNALENRQPARTRGFESLPLRSFGSGTWTQSVMRVGRADGSRRDCGGSASAEKAVIGNPLLPALSRRWPIGGRWGQSDTSLGRSDQHRSSVCKQTGF